MSRRRLPPLNPLCAFEATARHRSFTAAAAELCVTQGAVSQQVKALETHFGMRLFHRGAGRLSLTDEAAIYAPAVSGALDAIHAATERLRRGSAPRRLVVSVPPSFAARWLVPRLGSFRQAHPAIDVLVLPDPRIVDFERDAVDVAIRFGGGRQPGVRAHRLLREEIFPVCAPALLPIVTPRDLRRHTLLHDEGHGEWRTWLAAAGVDGIDATAGPMFTDSSLVLQAAVAGQGVALASSVLARDDLAAGRLVRPFALALPGRSAYHVVSLARQARHPAVAAFRDWALREAARDDADPPRYEPVAASGVATRGRRSVKRAP